MSSAFIFLYIFASKIPFYFSLFYLTNADFSIGLQQMQRVETLLRDKGRASRDDTSPAGSVLSVWTTLHGTRLQGLGGFLSTFITALQRRCFKVMVSVVSVRLAVCHMWPLPILECFCWYTCDNITDCHIGPLLKYVSVPFLLSVKKATVLPVVRGS